MNFWEATAGAAIGVVVCFGFFTAGRYTKGEEDKNPKPSHYVQRVDLLPAVNQVDCGDTALKSSLEHLRTCRARKVQELIRKLK